MRVGFGCEGIKMVTRIVDRDVYADTVKAAHAAGAKTTMVHGTTIVVAYTLDAQGKCVATATYSYAMVGVKGQCALTYRVA